MSSPIIVYYGLVIIMRFFFFKIFKLILRFVKRVMWLNIEFDYITEGKLIKLEDIPNY